jgi:lysophospholipase L1-like esterase
VFAGGAGAIVLAVALLQGGSAAAADDVDRGWVGVWATAHQWPMAGGMDGSGANWSVEGFAEQSVRQVVRVSAGGSRVRIRLSNRYGTRPLRVAGATIAKAGEKAAVRPGTVRPLTFHGSRSTTIPAGQETSSDAASLLTAPLESLTVTLFFAEATGPATFHENGLTTTYRAAGDHRFDQGGGAFAGVTTASWYYLSGVEASGGRVKGTVVAFGDSITDGYGSTADTDNRYPDVLAERLVAARRPLGVVNAGINGNQLLTDFPCFAGEKGVTRFARDALGQPGVRTAIVLEGVNDIGVGGFQLPCAHPPVATPESLIAGHRALIRAAHTRGVTIVGATLPPFKKADYYDTPDNEKLRKALNDWIRHGGEYDAVLDLDRVLGDPEHPDALRPAYDSSDHLHVNDAGMKAIADAVDLHRL